MLEVQGRGEGQEAVPGHQEAEERREGRQVNTDRIPAAHAETEIAQPPDRQAGYYDLPVAPVCERHLPEFMPQTSRVRRPVIDSVAVWLACVMMLAATAVLAVWFLLLARQTHLTTWPDHPVVSQLHNHRGGNR